MSGIIVLLKKKKEILLDLGYGIIAELFCGKARARSTIGKKIW